MKMKVKLIKIGNSLGVRLPKAIIEECHLSPELTLVPKDHGIELLSISVPREGWKDSVRSEIENRPVAPLGEWEW